MGHFAIRVPSTEAKAVESHFPTPTGPRISLRKIKDGLYIGSPYDGAPGIFIMSKFPVLLSQNALGRYGAVQTPYYVSEFTTLHIH